MRVRTYFSAAEAEEAELAGRAAVVIDVIRATSTIVEALAGGARAIYPTASTEDAIRLATSLGREDTLLCGERKGLKVEGFDLGNSPREFSGDQVRDRRLVMTTTNGTRAFVAAQQAAPVLVASFLNLGAVVDRLASLDGDLAIICAGKEGCFSLDDALCAGIILQELLARKEARGEGHPGLNDASRAALTLGSSFVPDVELLRRTSAGAALVEVGLGDDLFLCAQRDRHALVPEMTDRMIRLPPAGRA
jgi:2-phosphosulfolactate phosphatase